MLAHRTLGAVLALLAVASSAAPLAAAAESNDSDGGRRRWSVHLDNDLFAFADTDRDYTAGVAQHF